MADVMRLGRVPYAQAWTLQTRLVEQRAAGLIRDTVVVCTHDPVYTVGRKRGSAANLLDVGDVPVFEVERGGDVTFHGPGQIVAYPILLLEGAKRDLHAHLRRLETLMIDVCGRFGLEAGRDARNTGAWANGRKLGSIGISCRRWVTFHGLALNVNTDLAWFRRVNPCGFDATIMTSMAAELGHELDETAVEAALIAEVVTW